MVRSDRYLTSHFYETVGHKLTRVTESCWDKPCLFAKNESNFTFRLKTQAENVNHRKPEVV